MLHYMDMVHSHGVAAGFNTEATKRLHIDFAKLGYRASSKKGYIKQMTRWLTRRENIASFDMFLQWALEEDDYGLEDEGEEMVVDEEDDDDSVDVISTNPNNITEETDEPLPLTLSYGESTVSVAKFPPLCNVTLTTLIEEYGCLDFPQALGTFLIQHKLIRNLDHFWNNPTPATYNVYKRVRIEIPPLREVTKLVTMDVVRAQVACSKTRTSVAAPAQFDTVLAWKILPKAKSVDLNLLGPNDVSQLFIVLCLLTIAIHKACMLAEYALFSTFRHPWSKGNLSRTRWHILSGSNP